MKTTVDWVKIEERLPESDTVVLVCTELDMVTIGAILPGGVWSVLGGGEVKWWADFPLPPSKLKPQQPIDYRMIGWVD